MLKFPIKQQPQKGRGVRFQKLLFNIIFFAIVIGWNITPQNVHTAPFVQNATSVIEVHSSGIEHGKKPCFKKDNSPGHTHASLQDSSPYLYFIAHCSKIISAPSSFEAIVSGADISLSWLPPTVGSQNVSSYEVWRDDGSNPAVPIALVETGTSFVDQAVPGDLTSYQYRVRAVDSHGHPGPFSHSAVAGQLTMPIVTSSPLNATVFKGDPVTFSVVAQGSEPLTFQWREDDQNIIGATNASYSMNPASLDKDGKVYSVIVTNAAGNAFSSAATLTVKPRTLFYQDANGGLIVMEAEHASGGVPGQVGSDYENHQWEVLLPGSTPVALPNGASGLAAMTTEDMGTLGPLTGYPGLSPQLDWALNFTQTGTYYVWFRGKGQGNKSDSVHFGIDGAEIASGQEVNKFNHNDWSWENKSWAAVRTLEITTVGIHIFNIWMHEDGLILDKIVLTPDANYDPLTDGPLGPPESPTVLDEENPTPPVAVQVTTVSASELSVSWGPAEDDIAVTEYVVRRCLGTMPCGTTFEHEASAGNTTSYLDSTLLPSTSYWYDVVAKDGVGKESLAAGALGVTAADTQAPDAPLVSGTASGTVVTLIWSEPHDDVGVVGYEIQRCTGSGCTTFTDFSPAISETGTVWEDSTVTAGTTYRYQVIAKDSTENTSAPGESGDVTTNVDSTPPTVPRNVVVTAVSHAELTVTWESATDDVGIQDYEVMRCTGVNCFDYVWVKTVLHSELLSFTDTDPGLMPATVYRYQVRAQDIAGNWGPGEAAEQATLENPITTFYQDPTGGLIVMEAENASGGVPGQVGSRFENHQWEPLLPDSTPVVLPTGASGLAAMTTQNIGTNGPLAGEILLTPRADWALNFTQTGTYYVWIRGYGPDQTSDSVHFGIDGVDIASGQNVNGFINNAWRWKNKSSGTVRTLEIPTVGTHIFNIWMREDGFILDKIVLTPDANYDPLIDGPLGPPESPTGPTVLDEEHPTPPVDLQVTTVSASELSVSWGPASDDIAVTEYVVRRCLGTMPCGTIFEHEASAGSTTSYLDSALLPSTSYWYDVVAKDGVGKESPAAGALGVTAADTQAPDAPVVSGTASGTVVTLIWSEPHDNVGVVGYEIQRCTGSGCTTFTDFSPAISETGTVFEDSTVTAGTTYRYQVIAKDAEGNPSVPAESSDITTNSDGTPPTGPLNVQVTAMSHSELAVTWDAATDASGIQKYVVMRCLVTNCTHYDFVDEPVSVMTINDGNRETKTAYRYQVIAQDVAGNWGVPGYGEGSTLHEPIEFFVETGGIVSIEAENFLAKHPGKKVSDDKDYSGHAWTEVSTPAGASGDKGMSAMPKINTPGMEAGYTGFVPQMDWVIDFAEAGTYYVWLRGQGQGGLSDSVHFGIDGTEIASGRKVDGFSSSVWSWENTSGSSVRTVEIVTAGLHTLNLLMREDGFILDKIVLTKDDETLYIPTGEGPAESPTQLDTLLPSSPTLSIIDFQSSHLTVDWEPSSDDVQMKKYAISRCEGAGCTNFTTQGETNALTTEYPDSGLFMNTTYRYKVVAIDGVDNESEPGFVDVTTPPDQSAPTPPDPVGVAYVSGTAIEIVWTPSQDDFQVVAYDIRRCLGPNPCTSNDLIETVGGTTYQYADSGLEMVSTYRYEIIARDAAGQESNPASFVVTTSTQAPPSAVSNVYPADGATDISRYPTLEGTCGVPDVNVAQFRMASDMQMSSLVYDSGENQNDLCSHVAVVGLNPSTQYFWHMRIKNTAGDWSAWSAATSFTTTTNTSMFLNVFQDGIAGYSGTRDVDIRGVGSDPTGPPYHNWNQGKQDVLRIGPRPPGRPTDEIFRSLIKFDVSALTDPNAVLTAYVEMTGWEHSANDYFMARDSMYEIVRPWVEGNSVEQDDVNVGEVSWQFSEMPDTWVINGAAYAHDTDPNADRKSTPLVKMVAPNQVGYKTLWSSQALINTVKNWIANPGANQGLLMKADDESILATLNLASREIESHQTYLPRLVIVSSQQAFPAANQPPMAVLDTVSTSQGAAVLVPVLGNDFDADNSPSGLVIDQVDSPTNGTAEIIGDSIKYTPSAPGIETFAYTISDGTDKASAMIRVTVTGPVVPNLPPIAVNESYSMPSGVAQLSKDSLTGVLANDSDPENNTFTALPISEPSNGGVTLNPDGSFVYTPNVGIGGTDSFQYQAFDGVLYSPPATVTITVNGQPQTTDDVVHTPQSTAITIAVLANDTDDGMLDPATVAVQSAPTEGTTNVNTTTGEITYTASSNVGLYSFTYTAKDDQAYESLPATVTVDVTPSNNVAPNANSESYSGNQDAGLTVVASGVLGNDSDPNYDAITAVLDTNTSNGFVTLNADGSFTYIPNAGFSGADSFTYHASDGFLDSGVTTVMLNINQKPVANADTAITLEDSAVLIHVLSNDTDDQMPLVVSVAVASGPANGTTSVDSQTGKITYSPLASFLGTDSFTYTIEDSGGLNSLPATVTINVTNGNVPPVVSDDLYTGDQENPVVVLVPGVLANDSDLNNDLITAVLVAGPTHGTLAMNADGSFTYTPNSGFNGQDSFTYMANDGTINSLVASVGFTINPPIIVSFQEGTIGYAGTVDTFIRGAGPDNSQGNQSRIRWDTIEEKYGLLRFENIFGSGSGQIPSNITIQSATVTLEVSDGGDAADIHEVAVDWIEDQTFNGFGGEPGVQPDELGALIRAANGETLPLGSLVIDVKESLNRWLVDQNANHGWIFVPTASNVVDVRSRSHGTVTERPRLEVSYTLGITNQAPVATNETYAGNQDANITIAAPGVLSNDSDGNLDPLTVVLDTNPSNGTLTLNVDGSVHYIPNAGFSGTDSFTYHAHDGELDSQVATVTLTINGKPIAANDTGFTLQNTAVIIAVLSNDSDDVGLVPATVTVMSAPANGTTSVDVGTGAITYTPAASYLGLDTLTYTVEDAAGLVSNTATVTVEVTNGNLPPLAVDDAYSSPEDHPLMVSIPGVLANDSDPNSDPLTAIMGVAPSHGQITFNGNGSFTYTPNAGFNGSDSFTYEVNDGTVNSTSATVQLTIVPPVTVIFQQDVDAYSGTVDTFLRGAAPDNSHGGQARIRWSTEESRNALLRFENIFGSGSGQIPSNATIQSATLRLVASDGGAAADIYESEVNWDESATFNNFGGDPDVQADELGALVDVGIGTIGAGTLTIDVTESLARWAVDPASNFGWIFIPKSSDGVDVHSQSYGTLPDRPQLEVTYTVAQ